MNRDAKFYLRVTIITLFVLFIGGYAYFQSRKLIGGPKIVIESPQNGTTVTDSLIEIKGQATNIRDISLNDRPIFIDEQGHFNEKLLLPPGLAIITMKAKDRFGRTTLTSLELYYDAGSNSLKPEDTSRFASTTLDMTATTSTSTISQ